jgi:hypothetical protein
MELLFADRALQDIAESTVRSDARFGTEKGALLRQRLSELMAADSLAIAATLPTLRVDQIDSSDVQFAIGLQSGWRLLIEVAGSIPRTTTDGAVDLARVQAIRVVMIEESDDS